eukprot:CAMPEP_0170843230 /NCGR_PEP_ID=MMETSP0734-20130129/6162_1 /TAXON_ID=186038 /ORGANISM="Fragilariopsis kerguelensis, Strain L26-C5" /LENGTH=274 /DNA_ID=CAMNT_0011211415 /DNA_START=90 /DNA_END=911 /DNA_ORIENTATION=+
MPLTDTTNASNIQKDLEKNTLVELKALCKMANVPITGTKRKLIGFLLNQESHQKSRRKARTSGPEAAKMMIGPWSILTGIDDADKDLIDPSLTEKCLRNYAHSLAATVDADWHDSYERTGEELRDYMNEAIKRGQACLRVISTGMGYDSAFRTLCTIADTWDDINCIPFRGNSDDDIADGEYDSISFADTVKFEVHFPHDIVDTALPIVLAKAASDPAVTDSALERMIKDAKDHHVESPHLAVVLVDEAVENDELGWVADGHNRLASIYNARKW